MIILPVLLAIGAAGATKQSNGPPGSYPIDTSFHYPAEDTHSKHCVLGERRRFDYSQCSEYEECVRGSHRHNKWEKKRCADGYAFNDYNGNCKLDEKCAISNKKCTKPFYRISCSELLICDEKDGAYVRTNCPDEFRNDFNKGCIHDPKCVPTATEPKPDDSTCKEGAVRPTANCRTYRTCKDGKWESAHCKDSYGVWNAVCSECDPGMKYKECKEGQRRPVNTTAGPATSGYGNERVTVDCGAYEECEGGVWTKQFCAPNTGYDVSTKRCTPARLYDSECTLPVISPRCEDGARIAWPHSCRSFMQCDRGEWREFSCPEGHKFDRDDNRCVVGKCEDGTAVYGRRHHHHEDDSDYEDDADLEEFLQRQEAYEIPPFQRPNGFPGPLPPIRGTPAHTPGCLGPHPCPARPTYSVPAPAPTYGLAPTPYHPHHHQPVYNEGDGLPAGQAPSYPVPVPSYPSHPTYPAHPSYPSPAPPTYPHRPPGLICEGDYQVADPHDSSFYYDCVKGYLQRKRCPRGTLFDPRSCKCERDYTCSPEIICYDNQVLPAVACGEYKICRNNEWIPGWCPGDQAFINGVCDRRKKCKEICPVYPPTTGPYPTPVCSTGAVRPDYGNPLGYLECDWNGRWVKRLCEQGGVFDKRSSRCFYYPPSSHPSPSYPPTTPDYHPACYEGETKADKRHCTKYQYCVHGRFEERYCSYGSGFNGVCCQVDYHCKTDVTEGVCQESAGLNGFLADRSDCSYFYQCAQGRWVRMPCAGGTHFNPAIGVCDHIGNVPGCGWTGPRY